MFVAIIQPCSQGVLPFLFCNRINLWLRLSAQNVAYKISQIKKFRELTNLDFLRDKLLGKKQKIAKYCVQHEIALSFCDCARIPPRFHSFQTSKIKLLIQPIRFRNFQSGKKSSFFLFRLKSNNNRKKKWRIQHFHKLNAIE